MPEKALSTKHRRANQVSGTRAVGHVFAFRSAMWMIKGMFLAPSQSGGRAMCLVLGRQPGGSASELSQIPTEPPQDEDS